MAKPVTLTPEEQKLVDVAVGVYEMSEEEGDPVTVEVATAIAGRLIEAAGK
jgi:hypothetical protein